MVSGPSSTLAPAILFTPKGPAGPMTQLLDAYPRQRLLHLDAVWIQVAGTLCNLACEHCFVSAGPGIERHAMMSRDAVRRRVLEGLGLGAREFYLTGGEPFLHPELIAILEDTLDVAPCTVLTNGTLLTGSRVASLRRLSERGRYSLEVRISFDGGSESEHDALRGAGAFARALDGLRELDAVGLLPIATVTLTGGEDPLTFRERFAARMRAAGIARPRIKLLPLFALGRETARVPPLLPAATLEGLDQEAVDEASLPCGTCRAVTSQGVFVCPLLVDEPGARMGDTLTDSRRAFTLSHAACATCWMTGATCANG
jgi:AdoMet-dependent heme synthase